MGLMDGVPPQNNWDALERKERAGFLSRSSSDTLA